jgi:hypothetical protein
MPKGLGEVVDTTAKGVTHGGVSYFPSPKDLSKQQRIELKKQLNEICTKLNSVVSVMNREFELQDTLEDESAFHLRIDCDGMKSAVVDEFIQKLKGCGLDADRYSEEINRNLGFPGVHGSSPYIAVKGKNETFQVSDELRTFAEKHPKRGACCNIL